MGAKRLEESSYCPQRTRRVSREGQRGGEESCGPGCCGRSKGSGAEDGSLDLTPKKVTDFRAHTQYNVCVRVAGGGGGRGSPGWSWRLRSGKCVVSVDSSKEADTKGESVI